MTVFDYIEDSTPIPDSDIVVSHVANVIPLHVKYSYKGDEKLALAYIDYETQALTFADSLPLDVIDELKEKVIHFLQRRNAKYGFTLPEPPEDTVNKIYEPIITPEVVNKE